MFTEDDTYRALKKLTFKQIREKLAQKVFATEVERNIFLDQFGWTSEEYAREYLERYPNGTGYTGYTGLSGYTVCLTPISGTGKSAFDKKNFIKFKLPKSLGYPINRQALGVEKNGND